MEIVQLSTIIFPLTIIITILVSVILYLRRKNEGTDYEKEMKRLRQLLLKGKLDRKSFLRVRDNLKVEALFADEIKRLDNMLTQKSIDSESHRRMKKILEMSFTEKLEIIDRKYKYVNQKRTSQKMTPS
ncbi:hypothetical protein ACFLRN_02715 [Thermoproteota archaeon]